MTDCENLSKCVFIKQVENNGSKLMCQGLVKRYCKGEEQNACVRKRTSRLLGGPEKVPMNMAPNGLPLVGTNRDNWPKEIATLK
jgi:hypothetical protein